MTVTALLVSHDGARWLPAVIAGLRSQTRLPDRVVAVDTGSEDESVRLLQGALGAGSVLSSVASASYGEAVRIGLDHLRSDGADPGEWIWLLHDDSNPAPDALEVLLDAAKNNPSVAILGPKLREWPSLRRLLEVGVTISGTGRRETGLERGEYDQGQHDQVRDVLAVNTAGMLVRRDVLEQLHGFDRRLPLFGNDVDFGWRAARAGHRAMVVPDAVVFHAEAAHRGLRRTPVTGGRPRRAERRAALYTLLVNGSAAGLPFQVVRLFLGSLVRALGLLLVRAPGEAFDELVALLSTYGRPDRVVAGRLTRRRGATVGPRAIRHLLAPPWLPYRHGLDFVSDVATAIAVQAGEAGARRTLQRTGRSQGRRSSHHRTRVEATETGPVPAEAQDLPPDTGLLVRLLTNPVAIVLGVLLVLAVVSSRGVLGGGSLSGGALLPAPDGAMDWWRLYLESWHDLDLGSAAPAAPYLLPLALAGTVLLGKAWLVVDVLFLMTVPLAAWGAYRFFVRLTASRPPALWGAVTYGLLPVLGGAVSQGRLGTVVAAVVLPWLAHAALFLWQGASTDRRWRAAWRTGLLLALLSAFVPLAWPLAVVLSALGLVVGRLVGTPPRVARLGGPLLAALATTPVLLLPWSGHVLFGGDGVAPLLAEAGLTVDLNPGAVSGWDLAFGRPGSDGSAPGWISAGLTLAALAALLRADTRRRVLAPWTVLVVSLLAAAALAGREVSVPATGAEVPLWPGFLLLVMSGAAVTASVLAATGLSGQFSGSSFGWRQPVALVVAVLALATPAAGLWWWVTTGVTAPVDRRPAYTVPVYMVDAAEADPLQGTLVLRGNRRAGIDYLLLRGDGRRLGDDTVLPSASAHKPLTALVRDLVTAPDAEEVAALSRYGVRFLYAPGPVDRALAGALDSTSGLTVASAVRPGARAWQLEAEPTGQALAEPGRSLRPWWLLLQLVALLVVLVLATPSRRVRR